MSTVHIAVARAALVLSTCDASGLASHLVAEGDTWFDIAQGAQVSMRSLLEINDSSANDTIHPWRRPVPAAGNVDLLLG